MHQISTWTADQWEAIGLVGVVITIGYIGIMKLIEWGGNRRWRK